MCEFVDMDGNPVGPGDIVEHWKNYDRSWVPYKIRSVESVRQIDRVKDSGDNWVDEVVTKVTVVADPVNVPKYSSYGTRFKSSKNVRKVS